MAKLLLKPLSRVDDNSYKIMSIGVFLLVNNGYWEKTDKNMHWYKPIFHYKYRNSELNIVIILRN